jgi:hypothetical protein
MVEIREARAFAAEIKFLVDADTGRRIREWARAHLSPDPYGTGPCRDEYRTTSLYFDTWQHDVFHRQGSFARAKYRIRRYTDSDHAFLERKLRRPGMVVKRRTIAALDTLDKLTNASPNGPWPGAWFHRRLLARGLRPVCQLSYHRMARGVSHNGAMARLTLDDTIGVAPIEEPRFSSDALTPVLPGQLVLELKFRGQPPALFKQLIEEFRLIPCTVSKYRLGMMALGHVGAADEETVRA